MRAFRGMGLYYINYHICQSFINVPIVPPISYIAFHLLTYHNTALDFELGYLTQTETNTDFLECH